MRSKRRKSNFINNNRGEHSIFLGNVVVCAQCHTYILILSDKLADLQREAEKEMIMSSDRQDTPEEASRDRISLRLSRGAQEALREIKEAYDLTSDAEAVRIALGTERRMVEAFKKFEHVLVADQNRKNVRELVFSHWQTARR